MAAMTLELRIEKLIRGGLGLGRLADGQVVMAFGALPGELVRVAATKRHRQYLEAELIEVREASPARVSPPCPHYGQCGGCALQHLDYPEQVREKNLILAETLARAGLAVIPGGPLPSSKPFAYRQRIRLQAAKGKLGYFSRQSHHLVEISSCLLAEKLLNETLARLRDDSDFHSLRDWITAIELVNSPAASQVVLIVHYQRKTRPAEHRAAKRICLAIPEIKGLVFSVPGQTMGPGFTAAGQVEPRVLKAGFTLPPVLVGRPLTLFFEPGGFCQVNLDANEKMIGLMLAWLKESRPGRALDLFSGMGNFSLPLAAAGWALTGLDRQRATIRGAIANARAAGLADHCRFSQESAMDGAARLLAQGEEFDCLVLDPPRSGCAELIPLLPGFKAQEIIYISCDPATLGRDLVGLTKAGYFLAEARMVDMFPQTGEQESMVRMRAKW